MAFQELPAQVLRSSAQGRRTMPHEPYLEDIANEVFAELKLSGWRVRYAAFLPEKIMNKRPAPDSAEYADFGLTAGAGGFLRIYIRVPAEHVATPETGRPWIKKELIARIRDAWFSEQTN